jgi:hypothetical protein
MIPKNQSQLVKKVTRKSSSKKAKSNLIKMVNYSTHATADVHPEMVEHYQAGGFTIE